jgi:hypothetical protein
MAAGRRADFLVSAGSLGGWGWPLSYLCTKLDRTNKKYNNNYNIQ